MTNPTPHGQVPDALIDLIDAYAETRHRCGGIYNARKEAARKAVIEALSGVQALSAAPAGWKLVPEDATEEMVRATDKVNFANADTDGTMHNVWNVMLAATPTPPVEQQAQPGAVYAELHEPDATTVGLGAVWNRHSMRDFADRTHALRQAVIAPELQAEARRRYDAAMEQAAPKAAPGVGSSGFDYQTAADFLSGKTVSDEAVRKFVAASRWAHDEKAALSATLLAMHGVLTSREAEIALLKKALLEAEAAPQQEAQEPYGYVFAEQYAPTVGSELKTTREVFTRVKPDRQCLALYAAPQPSPAPLSDDTKRLAWMADEWTPGHEKLYDKHVLETGGVGGLDDLRTFIDKQIAAQGGKV